MYIFVMSLIVLVAVLLVLVILAQNSKGGGLTSQFGGSGASNMIGVKKTGDLLERITWGFVIVLLVLSFSTKFIFDGSTGSTEEGGPILGGAGQVEAPIATPPSDIDAEENTAPAEGTESLEESSATESNGNEDSE